MMRDLRFRLSRRTELGLGKADRVWYQESTPNHAMVFVGVDTLGAVPYSGGSRTHGARTPAIKGTGR